MKAYDLTNKVFGKLTAIEVIKIGNKRGWKCICECGNKVNVPTFQLTSGNNKSCGCGRSIVNKGERYGKLTVIKIMYHRDNKKDDKLMAFCECDCGIKKNVYTRNLTRGVTKHCGCMRIENISKSRRGEYGESSKNTVIASYKNNAKNKNISFDLTNEKLIELFKGNCYYCNDEPKNILSKDILYGEYVYNGIDRLDNSKGYITNNVVSCCSVCNYLKNSYTDKQFLEIIFKIAKNFKYTQLNSRDCLI